MDRRPVIIASLVVAMAVLTALAPAGCGTSGTTTTIDGTQSTVTTGPSTDAGDSVPPADMVGPFTQPDYLDPQPVDLARP